MTKSSRIRGGCTMAKIEGSIYCEKCNSEIKWCYLVRQHLGSARILEVDTMPDDFILLSSNPTQKEVKVRCKKCDSLNKIRLLKE